MYKLLLVDDEAELREGMLQEVNWSMYGFEIVGAAENGKEAFELVEKFLPDIVITDIKMPFMDGLALSELIKETFPTTKIIILTGFEEFEFAQKAISLHVNEYVLKPFSQKEFIDVLYKVKLDIDAEIAHKEDISCLKEHYVKSLPVLRKDFLISLISKKLTAKEIEEKCKNFDIHITDGGFIVSVLHMDYNSLSLSHTSYRDDSIQQSNALKLSQNKDLCLFAIFNITEEIINKHSFGIVFVHNNHVIVLALSNDKDKESTKNKTFYVLEEIRQSVEKYLKLTVTIGVGTFHDQITNVPQSYKNALLALDYRLIQGNNRIICIEDMEYHSTNEKIWFDELKEQSLVRCLKVGTVTEVKDIIDTLLDEAIEKNVSLKEWQIYLMEIVTTILKVAKDSGIDFDTILGTSSNVFSELFTFTNLLQAKEWIAGICTRIIRSIISDREYTTTHMMKKARQYIQNHYHESDININTVAKHLHISTGYFSSLFKKETKTTFVSYLLQIRMAAAKELLRSTDMKTYEIAEKIGSIEPNYFTFCFKKNFGITPKEYRSSSRKV
ncbi:MAG: transcriptional regulator [Clostridia bacterium]|jgi:two-component system response regulator YesN|nr:transcriptional regulator [Clostridia bacterium]